ncbi:MAG: 16S rRNA (adenine(1518)-N(6)/adenine(1519)-N(6))-dimethyltransferase RsmA [Patescibacteria group bacterium]
MLAKNFSRKISPDPIHKVDLGFRAKKSLGQNWLTNPAPLARMIEAARLAAGETVLEVGPGTGSLTAALLATGAKVVAVEKDDRLISLLQNKFAPEIKSGQLTLIHKDILDFLKTPDASVGTPTLRRGYKLIANLPYYITGQLLRQVLTSTHQPSLVVVMLQKEVAERIVSKNNKESLLSISVKIYGEPKYVATVRAGNFQPVPKVDSAILLIDQINKNKFVEAKVSEEKVFQILKQGFGSKRKMLKNNLGVEEEVLTLCTLDSKVRAEDLKLEDWLCLSKNI